MSLTPDDVRRLARLARIAIQPAESGAVLDRLNRVLGLIDQMRRIDTAGIEPMAHAADAHLSQGQRLRPDEVREASPRESYQSVAPAVEDGLYLVPKVIE
ncbi:MAG TPA: Asp-tRNA(Asn)/Glu-tRNA(Gln) amidotransferase subunit GatC [Burkholderiales bacterium]|nr:Asp-tRNA(Asn)/Glu-tRNA(Gln) amidotransferase subunit GatC [Burkholderiales bacterium]